MVFNSINLLGIGPMSFLITDSEHLSQSRFCSGHSEQLHHSCLRETSTPPPGHRASNDTCSRKAPAPKHTRTRHATDTMLTRGGLGAAAPPRPPAGKCQQESEADTTSTSTLKFWELLNFLGSAGSGHAVLFNNKPVSLGGSGPEAMG